VSGGESNLQRLSWDSSTETIQGEPRWITRGSNTIVWPDPSPDGEWVAYSTTGREDLFVARLDGTLRRRLTDDPYRDRMPRWSPDGKRIAFYSNRSGNYQIWTIRPDGSGLRPLTENKGSDFMYPVWSPDGSLLAYSSDSGTQIIDPGKPWKEQTPRILPP